MAEILDGRKLADELLAKLAGKITEFKRQGGLIGLATILIGDDPASRKFVNLKQKKAESLGIDFHLYEMLPIVSENQILALIADLNKSESICGIVVQLPLPENFNEEKIILNISKEKDVDNLSGESKYKAPVAKGIIELLKNYNIEIKGKNVAIIGRGKLVGQPTAKELLSLDARVEMIGSDGDLSQVNNADIIISGVGKPDLIGPEFVNKNTILIDAGTSSKNNTLIGDISQEAYKKAKAYAPVPRGIGPLTIWALLDNTFLAAKKIKQ